MKSLIKGGYIMVKIIFNNDTEHAIEVENFNYSVTFRVDNYSTHSDNVNFNIIGDFFVTLQTFENVAITSIKIMNSNDEDITTLTFEDELYILNYNGNVYETGVNAYVNLGKVNN
jgi:hypothetical protein